MQTTGFPGTLRGVCRFVLLAGLLAIFFLSANRTSAQNSSSGVNGTVTDQNGAVIGGAQIVLRNVATNAVRGTASNGSGNYFFTNVPPARYTLSISSTGFERSAAA